MPTFFRDDEIPVVQFDPMTEISPFILFRRLSQGQEILLVDCREAEGRLTLRGGERWVGPEWEPPEDRDVVFFDQDGSRAVALVRQLQAEGWERVRALFGGLDLYEFSLDPEVLGEDTFLVRGKFEAPEDGS